MIEPAILSYKNIGDIVLNLHVFTPVGVAAGDRHPAIVFFSCGGWNGWNPDKFYPQSQYLASRGMAAINAEVRVISRHGTSPTECVVDGKSSVRWVRAHAGQLGVDPDRIAASGGSAGGHVACCAGMIDRFDEAGEDRSVSSKASAMVLYNPALDTVSLQRRIERFGGLERARALSPLHHVRPDLPPAVVLHGADDEVVDVEQAYRFEQAMRDAGNRCDLYVYDGQGHGFFNYFDGDNPMFTETVRETDRFLTSLGYLSGEPTIDNFQYTPPR